MLTSLLWNCGEAFSRLPRNHFWYWLKGFACLLFITSLATAVYYVSYDQLKVAFGFKDGQRKYLAPALAGGAMVATLMCPAELIRTKPHYYPVTLKQFIKLLDFLYAHCKSYWHNSKPQTKGVFQVRPI